MELKTVQQCTRVKPEDRRGGNFPLLLAVHNTVMSRRLYRDIILSDNYRQLFSSARTTSKTSTGNNPQLSACEPKENISKTFFKYSKYKT